MRRNSARAAAVIAVTGAAAARGQVLAGDFSADPRVAGWTYTGPAGTGWSAQDGGSVTAAFDRAAGGQTWRSPSFPVDPAGYYRVTFRSRATAPGYAATVFANPADTWGKVAGGPDLIADDFTGVPASAGWVDNAFDFRPPPNAATAAMLFRGVTAGVRVAGVRVTAVTAADVAAGHDAVYAGLVPLRWTPDADRFAHLARTAAALRPGGGPLAVVLLGDSIMNDTAQSNFGTLLERSHPGARVTVVAAVGGGASLAHWNPDSPAHRPGLDLRRAVVDQRPDLVLIGGVSNAGALADTDHVVDLIRRGVSDRFGYVPDVTLVTGTLNRAQNPAAPIRTWTPTVNPDSRDYRAGLCRLAQQRQAGFLDLTGVWGQYMVDAQHGFDRPTYNAYFRDDTHFNTRGKEVLARVMTAYLSPDPAP